MIKVFTFDVYVLLDPRENLSFVISYVALNINVPKQLSESFTVSRPVGDSILAERAYHDCTISINHKNTMTYLIELDMIDLDCHSWYGLLHACFASVDCSTSEVSVFK